MSVPAPNTPQTWACLGDSLTNGVPQSPTTVERPWPDRIDTLIFPERSAANHGFSANTIAQMKTRYLANIQPYDYYGVVFWGGANDLIDGDSGPTVWAAYEDLVDTILADGLKLICIMTSPMGSYSGWSAGRQTAIEYLYERVLALEGSHANLVAVVDFYKSSADGGLGDPDNPDNLDPDYEGVATDGVHHGEDAHDVIVETLLPLMAAEEEAEETSSIVTFGVTASSVRTHCFPRLNNFSGTTSPTSTIVGEKIDTAAAKLAAALLKEEITPASIVALGTLTPSYTICADIIRKLTALSLHIPADDPETRKGWQKDVDDFFALLDEDPAAALANASLGTSESDPDGPTHHIDEYSLDIGDTGDASDAVPALRKDDSL